MARSNRFFRASYRLPHLWRRIGAREDLQKELKDLRFNVERSIRYHYRRQGFFETFDTCVNVANLVLGSWAVVVLLDATGTRKVALLQGAAIAILSFVNLAMRSAEKSSQHSQFRQRYFDLLRKLQHIAKDSSTLKADLAPCYDAKFDIEREEPPAYCVVDLLAHNEQARAQGEGDDCVYYIPRFMRLTANFWRYDTNNITTIQKTKEAKEQAQVAKQAKIKK